MFAAQSATSSAQASEDQVSSEVASIIDAQLEANPGGIVVGNEIHYGDGLTFVAVEAGTLSLSQCASGRFCGWAQSNYSGSFYSTSGTGVKTLSWTARSYANKRSSVSHLYNSAGSASTCFAPGQGRATIGSTYYSPSKVNLSSATSC